MPFHESDSKWQLKLQEHCGVKVCIIRAIGTVILFKVVTDCKSFREDALRHLRPYQCQSCGRRFAKRCGRSRHYKKRNQCIAGGRDGNDTYKPVSAELRQAVKVLEEAKGYEKVTAAIDRCQQLHRKCPINVIQTD